MTTHPDITSTRAFQSLASESLEWSTQTWGDARSLSWSGPDHLIQKAHAMFSNYDLRAPDHWGNAPAAPRLSWASETVAYIYLNDERLASVLTLYFDCMLRYYRETGVANPVPCPIDSDVEGEVTPEWEAHIHDDTECARLAAEMAHHFIDHHIEVKCFMPESPKAILAEHSIGRGEQGDHTEFESLVDQAATA